MPNIYNSYTSFQYSISGAAQMATHFYPIEKASKISFRIIDLANMFIENPHAPLILLSSQIKDLVLAIESTRFFCVSFPLFFRDKREVSFFQEKSRIQCAERISLTFHLALKTLFGADRTGLIRLGLITYTYGNLKIFRWMVEGSIWMYNFFGAWDSSTTLIKIQNELKNLQSKIDPCDGQKTHQKDRKWTKIQELCFDQTKAELKIAATISKLFLITLAVTLAAFNISNVFCQTTILSLAILSDCLGLTSFYHQEYYHPFMLT